MKPFNAFEIHNDRLLAKEIVNELGAGPPTQIQGEDGSTFMGFLPTVVWSGDLTDYLETTNQQVASVQADIDHVKDKLPADFLSSWDTFKGQWKAFYETEKDSIHVLDVADKMDQTDAYVERLKNYQLKMQSLGQAKNVPGVTRDPHSVFNPDNGLSSKEKAVIGVTAAGVIIASVAIVSKRQQPMYPPRRFSF